jgi:hypothetical protein
MRIESGPTGERKVRTLLMFLMVAVFGVWFGYDGWTGYPAANLQQHLDQLRTEEGVQVESVPIYPKVTAEMASPAREAIKKFDLAGQRAELERVFANPPSYEGSEAWYYLGPAHRIVFPLENGRLTKAISHESQHTALDILLQKVLAAILGVTGVYLAWHLTRVVRTRLVLDDEGIVYRGRGAVKWNDMRALRTEAFAKKGRLDLVYQGDGVARTMRLDEYHLARFDAVIDAICQRKGFENPLPVEEGAPDREP